MNDSARNQPPADSVAVHDIMPLIFGTVQAQVVRAAASLGITDLIKDESRSLEDLASATDTRPDTLVRVMRVMERLGLVKKDSAGNYSCTDLGAVLQGDHPYTVRHYALMNNSEWLITVEAHLVDSLRSGLSAAPQVHGKSCYEYLQGSPEDAAVFHASLTELSQLDALGLRQVYDFSPFHTVVDVGGGAGFMLRNLLDGFAEMQGILFELPSVASAAETSMRPYVEAGRCRIVAGDFLEGVPEGGDLYLLKRVLSTSSEADVRALLNNIRRVIGDKGRVLIADPDPQSLYGALFDVLMLVAVGGALHTEQALKDLLESTGFRCTLAAPTPATLRMVEAVPA